MMRLLPLLFLLIAFSCHTPQKTGSGQGDLPKTVRNCQSIPPLPPEMARPMSDPFDIDSLAIDGNCLAVYVSYGGGCGSGDFTVMRGNKLKFSMPPQAELYLQFMDNDPCRSIVKDTLFFDLSPFEQDAEGDGIWLQIHDTPKKILFKR